ncbi:MAG: DMT family transporter [Anaerolineae bacterium]|nr:DMT family transporter [Anaerolineae bacterium]
MSHSEQPRYFYGVFMIVASSCVWALIEALGLYFISDHSPYQTIWVRYGAHLLFMFVALGPRYKTQLVRTNRLRLQIFRSLLMVGMPFFYITAIFNHMPSKDLYSVFWLSPLMVMGLAVLILGERVRLNRWIAALVAFAGVLIMLHPDRGVLSLQALLPFGMAFCFSLYRVLTRALRTENTFANLFYTAFGVWVVLSFLAPLFWAPLDLNTAIPMIVIGIIGYFGLYMIDKAYEAAPASVLAPFIYIEPIWGALFSFLLLHESPAGSLLLSLPIIIGAGLYLLYTDTRHPQAQLLATPG